MPIFTATFTPPPALTGLTVSAESGAAVRLEWAPSTLAPGDFRGYRIYRSRSGRPDDFDLLATIPDQATTVYYDYSAPLGVPIFYRLTQTNLDGYESAPAAAQTESTGCDWWIVTPGDASASFELPNATAAKGAWPIQSTAHEPIGRPFKLVETGDILGEETDLTLLLQPDQAAVVDQLRAVATTPGLLLKSPYGEVYPIALDTLRRTRLVGGRQEVSARLIQTGAQA